MLLFLSLLGLAQAQTISEAFPPPAGYERTGANAFGTYLQSMALRAESEPVRTHAGRVVSHKARVIDLPMVSGDLQQCADSAIRVRAQWLKDTGKPISFHATSGDPLPWDRFRDGETPIERNNRVVWTEGSTGKWEDWLSKVFLWAGTDSLARLDTVPSATPRPGDILVQGGFPGHAVVILDVAESADQTRILIGEGYMPAQSFHVEIGPDSGWWPWEPGLTLSHWTFDASHLRAFKP